MDNRKILEDGWMLINKIVNNKINKIKATLKINIKKMKNKEKDKN